MKLRKRLYSKCVSLFDIDLIALKLQIPRQKLKKMVRESGKSIDSCCINVSTSRVLTSVNGDYRPRSRESHYKIKTAPGSQKIWYIAKPVLAAA